jgi:hypothetical protein
MNLRYAVGIKIGNRADQMTVEADDALIAALKVKTAHPEAAITYVRKRNARGDRRHPHSGEIDENPRASGRSCGSVKVIRSRITVSHPYSHRARRRLQAPVLVSTHLARWPSRRRGSRGHRRQARLGRP